MKPAPTMKKSKTIMPKVDSTPEGTEKPKSRKRKSLKSQKSLDPSVTSKKSDKSFAPSDDLNIPAYKLPINDKNKKRVSQRRAQRNEFRITLTGEAREPKPTQGY